MEVITLENITKTFGTHKAVDDLSLRVPRGSIYGFIGPNGSGKTTTIRMIMIIPMLVMMPIILNPSSNFAIGMSLVPIWTPMLMVLRQATSVTIPAWQLYVGLFGVLIFTAFSVWAGARVFRSAIIMQGKKSKIGTLLRYIFNK